MPEGRPSHGRPWLLGTIASLIAAAGYFVMPPGSRGQGAIFLLVTAALAIATVAWSASDMTGRRRLQERLTQQALYDSLTGLANRALFTDRLKHSLAGNPRRGEPMSVLIIDLNRFTAVNDTFGHEAGDGILRDFAARLRTSVRPGDTAARLGGDEFGVLVERAGAPEAVRLAERLLERMKEPFRIHGRDVFLDASIGIAEAGNPTDADEPLRNADAAMFAAKREARGDYHVFVPELDGEVLRNLELEGELRQALERDEFILHYQPLVTIPSGRVVGVEALLRWIHPGRGLVPPVEFIPLAEETGLILAIDRWVLREACRQAGVWRERFSDDSTLEMNVNISARQLHHEELVTLVSECLAATGLSPGDLTLEITEGVLMQDTEATLERLTALKELGVRLAIDDFGIGFSSLSYLRRLPVDVVKIDRSFVTGVAAGAEEWTLARGIVRMVHGLGFETVAEGVETPQQVAHLQALGCQKGQGFYFARPMEPRAIEKLLARSGPRSA